MGLCRFKGIMDLPKQGLKRIKPGVNRSVHLFAAPLLWAGVGSMLIVRGWEWVGPGKNRWYLLAALAVGTIKSLFILDKIARKTVDRIVRMQDGTCLGAIYSWKTWLLVVLMMGSGIVLRTFFTPGLMIGMLYAAVGWALLFSSRLGWLAWLGWIQDKE